MSYAYSVYIVRSVLLYMYMRESISKRLICVIMRSGACVSIGFLTPNRDIYTMHEPDLYCYKLSYNMPYDPEAIWSLVQRHGGFISVHPGGHYEFLIPRDYSVFLIMAFPLLSRQRQKDLYV
jgi:hypothetical protein